MEKYHGKSTEQIIQKLMPGSVRSSVVMVWVVINFMILTPFLFPPTFIIYLYVILPFISISNIWGVWVFFYKPNEPRLVHILYNGFMGLTFSFGSFIVIQKIAYTFIEIETPLFFIVTFLLYILTIYKLISIGMKSFLRRLNNEEYKNFSNCLFIRIGICYWTNMYRYIITKRFSDGLNFSLFFIGCCV